MGFAAKHFSFLDIFLILSLVSSSISLDSSFKNGLEYFSHNLFHEIVKTQGPKNIIFSPFSAHTCLAIARMGAGGETAAELDNAMGFTGKSTDFIADNYYELLKHYENSSQVHVANKMYVMENCRLEENFESILKEKFFAGVEPINFVESEKSAETINKWVEMKTNNLIKDIIKSDNLNSDTRMVLLNAIHFKGEWEHRFDESKTSERDFYINEKESVHVPMMIKSGSFLFARLHSLNAWAVRLPYRDSDLSMLIIVPFERTDLFDLEEKLQTLNMESITKNLTEKAFQFALPKFKTETTLTLNAPLMNLKLKHMFIGADFSKMLKSPEPLEVSAVVQKAFIEVNEVGTEAAAATGAVWLSRSGPPSYYAEHPFHYVILNDDNVVLFQGNVVNPLIK